MPSLILIGTDHRLQQAIVQDEKTKVWIPRKGGHRYRGLIEYCIDKWGVKAILEEAHPRQEQVAPTIASKIAKDRGIVWRSLGFGEPSFEDALLNPPLAEALRTKIKPDMLAGIYNLETHELREQSMYTAIMESLRSHNCALAIVGYVHLGVLARMLKNEQISVKALLFTYPLVVDETKS